MDLMDYKDGIGGPIAELRSIAFLMQESNDPEKPEIGWALQQIANRLQESAEAIEKEYQTGDVVDPALEDA